MRSPSPFSSAAAKVTRGASRAPARSRSTTRARRRANRRRGPPHVAKAKPVPRTASKRGRRSRRGSRRAANSRRRRSLEAPAKGKAHRKGKLSHRGKLSRRGKPNRKGKRSRKARVSRKDNRAGRHPRASRKANRRAAVQAKAGPTPSVAAQTMRQPDRLTAAAKTIRARCSVASRVRPQALAVRPATASAADRASAAVSRG